MLEKYIYLSLWGQFLTLNSPFLGARSRSTFLRCTAHARISSRHADKAKAVLLGPQESELKLLLIENPDKD